MRDTGRVEIISHSPHETQAIGRSLGAQAQPGHVFLLVGELGTGKTCLAQGVLSGLGGDERARSPTFVLVSQYRGRLPMYHIDLYRLDGLGDIEELGLDEYLFGDGVCVVEWAEKGLEVLPEKHLMIERDYVGETTRQVTLIANGDQYTQSIETLNASFHK